MINNDLRRQIRAYTATGAYLASVAIGELPIGRHRATDPEEDREETETTTDSDTARYWARLFPAVAETAAWPDAAANRRAGGEG